MVTRLPDRATAPEDIMATLLIKAGNSADYGPGASFKLKATEMVEVSHIPYAATRVNVRDMFVRLKQSTITSLDYQLRSYGDVTFHRAFVEEKSPKTVKIGCQRFGIRATARLKKWALALK